jgi:uncharacterized membrane protein
MMALPLLALVLGSLGLLTIGWMGMTRKLPPYYFAGIRTPFTLRSSENWYATHEAGGPLLILGAAAGVAGGLAFLPFVIAGVVPDALVQGVVIAIAIVVLISVIASWIYGTRKAKAALSKDAHGAAR